MKRRIFSIIISSIITFFVSSVSNSSASEFFSLSFNEPGSASVAGEAIGLKEKIMKYTIFRGQISNLNKTA